MYKWVAVAIAASAITAIVVVASLYVPRTVTVEIINEGTTPDEATYEPQAISVQPRTVVVWNNTDASAHTVTSKEPAGIFDSGVMGPGQEFQFTFEDAGTFDYYCKIHPIMVGTVVVE